MVPFLKKFFPAILKKASSAETNIYCVYDSQVLTLFTSSLYLAGLVSSLMASRVTAAIGRRNTMMLGGCTFLAGGAVNGGAQNIAMLILGRILLGLGVGFTNQVSTNDSYILCTTLTFLFLSASPTICICRQHVGVMFWTLFFVMEKFISLL